MNKVEEKANPLVCPLCGESNSCVNLGAGDVSKTCWCNDPSIKFPEELLSQVAPELRRVACVCKSCALKYAANKGTEL